jgi:hypothetical protein
MKILKIYKKEEINSIFEKNIDLIIKYECYIINYNVYYT